MDSIPTPQPFAAISAHLGASAGLAKAVEQLRGFVEPGELSIVFQPIADMGTATLFAYEALVRCSVASLRDPTRLIELAARRGCAGALGRVIRQLAVPPSRGRPLFVNVHPDELLEGWLGRDDDPVFTHDSDVYLEVTETAPLLHSASCRQALDSLEGRAGIYFVVDDLGAGFSNLKRIADLEPKFVKVDRELIHGLASNPRQQQLLKSVVRLCADLGARVVAEGIETPDDFRAVQDSGAQFGQGYLIARPAFPPPNIYFKPELLV